MLVETPAHIVADAADGVSAVGNALTLTVVEPVRTQPNPSVMVTLYVPLIVAVALLVTLGFACEEVNPFGPVQANVYGLAPPSAFALRNNGEP